MLIITNMSTPKLQESSARRCARPTRSGTRCKNRTTSLIDPPDCGAHGTRLESVPTIDISEDSIPRNLDDTQRHLPREELYCNAVYDKDWESRLNAVCHPAMTDSIIEDVARGIVKEAYEDPNRGVDDAQMMEYAYYTFHEKAQLILAGHPDKHFRWALANNAQHNAVADEALSHQTISMLVEDPEWSVAATAAIYHPHTPETKLLQIVSDAHLHQNKIGGSNKTYLDNIHEQILDKPYAYPDSVIEAIATGGTRSAKKAHRYLASDRFAKSG